MQAPPGWDGVQQQQVAADDPRDTAAAPPRRRCDSRAAARDRRTCPRCSRCAPARDRRGGGPGRRAGGCSPRHQRAPPVAFWNARAADAGRRARDPAAARGRGPAPDQWTLRVLRGRGLGHVRKSGEGESRRGGATIRASRVDRRPDLSRDKGIVPWDWLTDESRTSTIGSTPRASTTSCWARSTAPPSSVGTEPPPLVLMETARSWRASGDVSLYRCPMAATNGQVGGFLHTKDRAARDRQRSPRPLRRRRRPQGIRSRRTRAAFWNVPPAARSTGAGSR